MCSDHKTRWTQSFWYRIYGTEFEEAALVQNQAKPNEIMEKALLDFVWAGNYCP